MVEDFGFRIVATIGNYQRKKAIVYGTKPSFHWKEAFFIRDDVS